jgi:isoleucyl-tRNA synthetase
VLGGALFKKNAFQNVIVNGIVLAEDGKKMSKKLQNYPDPMEIVEKYGADALRLYLLTSPVMQAENLAFSERGVDEILKKNLGRLNNVLAFYKLYEDGTPRDWKSENLLDRWIMARLDQLVAESTEGYEKYQLDAACRPIAGFIDDLSVWYLRRSRDRFKEEGSDRTAALATMRYVLHRLSLVIAPAMPFYAEFLFQEVREGEDEESVHLANWPEPHATANFFARLLGMGATHDEMLKAMTVARGVVTSALEAREKAGIKTRQPLARLRIPESLALSQEYLEIISDEVNVKSVELQGSEIILETEISEGLRQEGLVREAKRALQGARKTANLNPADKAKKAVLTISHTDQEVFEKHLPELQAMANVAELTLEIHAGQATGSLSAIIL